MRILFLGEIVGKPGILAVKRGLPALRSKYHPDFVIAGGSAITKGFGLGKGHALQVKKLGIDVLIGSHMILSKPDLCSELAKMPFILRPANFPSKTTPGRGFYHYKNKENHKDCVGIICLQGQSGHHRALPNNPFQHVKGLVAKMQESTQTIIICYHAQTTAEKQSMFYHMQGECAAVIGYGTRVITSDAKVRQGTATIADLGYLGSTFSIGGLEVAGELEKITSQRPLRSTEGPTDLLTLNGCLLEIGEDHKAQQITAFIQHIQEPTESPDLEVVS